MARTYKRDSRGRFASGGGSSGSGGRPKARMQQRGTNRLTRDNAGRIQGIGGSGATARGGRLRTASGKQRATQLDQLKGRIGGTVAKPRGLKPGAVKVKAPATITPTGRTRAQAAAVQRGRAAGLIRRGRSAPGAAYIEFGSGAGGMKQGSMKVRRGRSMQGNILSGGFESVKSGRRVIQSSRSALRSMRRRPR